MPPPSPAAHDLMHHDTSALVEADRAELPGLLLDDVRCGPSARRRSFPRRPAPTRRPSPASPRRCPRSPDGGSRISAPTCTVHTLGFDDFLRAHHAADRLLTMGVAQELRDDVARLLSASLGDTREPAGVGTLDADHNPQRRGWVTLAVLECALVKQRELRVEIAGLRIRVCPRFLRHRARLKIHAPRRWRPSPSR